MANNTAEILNKEFDSLKSDLIARHQMLGMKASGQWIESLENRSKGLSGQLWGEAYTEQLVNGRKPGKFPPIKIIEKWIYDKGITPQNISYSSLAFLIARKIAKEGTEYFKQGGTDLIESVITPQRIQSILDKVSEFQISSFTTEIKGVLKQMAA